MTNTTNIARTIAAALTRAYDDDLALFRTERATTPDTDDMIESLLDNALDDDDALDALDTLDDAATAAYDALMNNFLDTNRDDAFIALRDRIDALDARL